ncbi:hypothetical protein HDU83_007798 [Entophlyctis luteolus]|nr:hypothetical protein HDU82_002812 [Entophlyctis luteolus]KAJ3339047.1 hypothetical protein HDU83_007798 [Entophlyctis luteolus]KAJ3376816.1 hypothetical protein HDU84_009384 [Entophlyctis sp. JEL0112]
MLTTTLLGFLALAVQPIVAVKCTPVSGGSASIDDSPAINSAISMCAAGGTIVIPAGKTFMIASPLLFTGCTGCIFQIEGTLKVKNDYSYWQFHKQIMLVSNINGLTMTSTSGTGLFDGNGQASYDAFAANTSLVRPTLLYITGSSSITVSNLHFKNAPNVFISTTGSSAGIVFDSLVLKAVSLSSNAAKNTDGFDIGSSNNVVLQNITVTNDDDCIAFKPGANGVVVNKITCSGSHGISVGSLGGKAGTIDIVNNVTVTSATMVNSTKAVGIKLYSGGSTHGSALVTNVTFDGVTVKNSGYAVQIQSCYNSADTCSSSPSTATITGVYFKNFSGTTSTEYGTTVSNINCPAAGTCDIYFSNYAVTSPSGTQVNSCANIDSSPGITCSGGASG